MKYQILSLLFILGLSTTAKADVEKNINIGFASYALTIAYGDAFIGDDDYSGAGISVLYAMSNTFALRGTYYSMEHDDLPELENTGYDFVAYWGSGFTKEGFKAYAGGGFFTEDQEIFGFSDSFSGLQLNGGIGYNWSVISLDLTLGIRDPSDYEDFIQQNLGISVSAVAVSTSLILSARF
ncbi:hypothetical protein MNBD_GAMMA11-1011 [hydrothermal vent metagenome]|uniref:Outer membrane protein beta-barrel domain-containing protein n=1 Tax=hydrothermal vent metagenome TaxID=652676 RepID=A0A3B0XSF3_9ZZZZ